MIRALVFVFLASLLSVRGQDAPQVVDCGGTGKAVVIEASPNGRYAIGWGSLENPGQSNGAVPGFRGNTVDKVQVDPEDQIPSDGYKVVDCVIDMDLKSWRELPSTFPYYPHKNHGYIGVAWSDDGKYALVQNDAKWITDNLWLVSLKSSEIHDLAPDLHEALAPLLEAKRPLEHKHFATFYIAQNNNSTATFQGNAVAIPFESEVPKSMDENSYISGTLTVHLPDGAVIVKDTPAKTYDPFQSNLVLAAADNKLNQVYGKLRAKLSPDGQAKLKAEELVWIDQRNGDYVSKLAQDTTAEDRIEELIQFTKERTEALQVRLLH